MNNHCRLIFISILIFTFCFASYSQTGDRTDQIKRYCDSIDQLTDIQSVRKSGAGVTLDFILAGENVVKIIERSSGYKYISSIAFYYFVNNEPVFIHAEIELSTEDGEELTLELHKIYMDDHRIIKHFSSERTYNADSLYNANPDPVRTAGEIRRNAVFTTVPVDPEFERTLMQSISDYLLSRTRKDGDPIFDRLYSPFN